MSESSPSHCHARISPEGRLAFGALRQLQTVVRVFAVKIGLLHASDLGKIGGNSIRYYAIFILGCRPLSRRPKRSVEVPIGPASGIFSGNGWNQGPITALNRPGSVRRFPFSGCSLLFDLIAGQA